MRLILAVLMALALAGCMLPSSLFQTEASKTERTAAAEAAAAAVKAQEDMKLEELGPAKTLTITNAQGGTVNVYGDNSDPIEPTPPNRTPFGVTYPKKTDAQVAAENGRTYRSAFRSSNRNTKLNIQTEADQSFSANYSQVLPWGMALILGALGIWLMIAVIKGLVTWIKSSPAGAVAVGTVGNAALIAANAFDTGVKKATSVFVGNLATETDPVVIAKTLNTVQQIHAAADGAFDTTIATGTPQISGK